VVLRVGRDEGHAASPVSGHVAAAKRKRASMCWQLRQTATLDAPAPVSCISLKPSEGLRISCFMRANMGSVLTLQRHWSGNISRCRGC